MRARALALARASSSHAVLCSFRESASNHDSPRVKDSVLKLLNSRGTDGTVGRATRARRRSRAQTRR